MSAVILVLDSQRDAALHLAALAGLHVLPVDSVADATSLIATAQADLLVLQVDPSPEQTARTVAQLKSASPRTRIVLLRDRTGRSVAIPGDTQVAAIVSSDEADWEESRRQLETLARHVELERGYRHPSHPAPARHGLSNLVGSSEQMQRIYRVIEKTAHHLYPVLIFGESGTGKELVARSIHDLGPRRAAPFVPVDCSALAPSLIETELFGHVKGAFTGALNAKPGLMASASGGTLFLDEIGNLPMDLQAKLLRAIQAKEIKPVGSNDRIRTDTRIIAATNRDLEAGIREGNFRQDLYFRLNVVQIRIPPLRDRRSDIPVLVQSFIQKFSEAGARVREVAPDAMDRLMAYDWPGNVRELENAIERAMALSSGPILHAGDLPTNLQYYSAGAAAHSSDVLRLEDLERQAIYRAIRETGGDKLAAAKLLGIGKTTLYRKLREYEEQEDATRRR